jgi:hypothetical protein
MTLAAFAIAALFPVILAGNNKLANLAEEFFDCCETGKGWTGCSHYVLDESAKFSIQAVDALPGPKVTDNKSVKDYLDWMAGVVKEFGPKAKYEVKAHTYDSKTNTALFNAVFMGYSDYVYAVNMDPKTMKVSGMTKVWNDKYAFDNMPHLGSSADSVAAPAGLLDVESLSELAQDFFDCCETGKGWKGCSQYVTNENAAFSVDAVDALPGPNVTANKSVKDYVDWMAGVVKEFGPKATYTVKARGFDRSTNTALYYAMFMGYSDYVYSIKVDPQARKVSGLVKVWNDQYAFDHIPHAQEVTVVV